MLCTLSPLLSNRCADDWWQITNMVRTDETRAKIGKVIREQWANPETREVSAESAAATFSMWC